MARFTYIVLFALLAASASAQLVKTPMCGSQAGGVGCADASHCCSEYGFCGVGIDNTTNKVDFCGAKCQGGPCKSGAIALKPPGTSPAAPAATSKPKPSLTPNPAENFGTVLAPGLALLAGSVGTGLLGRF